MSERKKSKPLTIVVKPLRIAAAKLQKLGATYWLEFPESSCAEIECLLNSFVSDLVHRKNERTITNAISKHVVGLRGALMEARDGGYAAHAVSTCKLIEDLLHDYEPAFDKGGPTPNSSWALLFNGLEEIWIAAGGASPTFSKRKGGWESKFVEFVNELLSLIPLNLYPPKLIPRKAQWAYDTYRQNSCRPDSWFPLLDSCTVPHGWMDGSLLVIMKHHKASSVALRQQSDRC